MAHSPYFAALLDTNQFREVTTSNRGKLTFVTLSNILADTFALLLKFIYTGRTEVSAVIAACNSTFKIPMSLDL